ncbi:hypothetical protein CP533_2147 [Ophiocordyceps camponoti-saundersi (nom. inval.)]|nr:hypothetical protein CP533_2147 [Ophiocordyceps camponoti-saundersi (nom. inval.)]
MASPRLIPSNAVIHALRGILLTTSCAFVLVAEERRRRLYTAYAIVENARRLHHVRQCLACPESESEAVPSTSRRRRRHKTHKTAVTSDPDTTETTPATERKTSTSKRKPAPLSCSAKRPHHHSPSTIRPFSSLSSQQPVKETSLAITAASASSRDALNAIETAKAFLSGHGTIGMTYYDDALTSLLQLRYHLASPSQSPSTSAESIQLAATILKSMSALGPAPPDASSVLMRTGAKLLRIALRLRDEEAATSMVDSLLLLCRNPLRVFNAITDTMEKGGSTKYMEHALEILTSAARKLAPRDCTVIQKMLVQQKRSPAGFQGTKRFYEAMLIAGLFDRHKLWTTTEYEIRICMIVMAIQEGAQDLVRSEMLALQALSPDAHDADMKLHMSVAVWEAMTYQWESAFGRIRKLERLVYSDCREFQKLVRQVIDLFVRLGPEEHVDPVVRGFVARYRMRLRYKWVDRILDRHGQRRDEAMMLSWLQFCSENGLLMSDFVCKKFLAKCREYWCFSNKALKRLQSRLDQVRREHAEKNVEATGAHSGVITTVDKARKLRGRGGLLPALMAQIDAGVDPDIVIMHALKRVNDVHDVLFNKAARALAASGNLQAAADLCEAAAKVKGKGHPLYNRYIFTNLVFSYTVLLRYQSLGRLLDDFQSEVLWWRGGDVVKAALKYAMRVTAMRTADAGEDSRQAAEHRQALYRLAGALGHVKLCRANNEQRRRLSDGLVAIVKTAVVKEAAAGAKKRKTKDTLVQTMHAVTSDRLRRERHHEADVVVVGAGVFGCAIAFALANQGRSVLLLERRMAEPDRIVGELLQPGGMAALRRLGLGHCVDEIDAITCQGYHVLYRGQPVDIPYPPIEDDGDVACKWSGAAQEGKRPQGRSFHHGRFIMRLRASCLAHENITVVETEVTSLVSGEHSPQVLGVEARTTTDKSKGERRNDYYFGSLTIVADGYDSKFRRQVVADSKPQVRSKFYALELIDCPLPRTQFGLVVIGEAYPMVIYQIGTRETRALIDVPVGLPAASPAAGGVRAYIRDVAIPAMPPAMRPSAHEALADGKIPRSMPNSWLPASPQTTDGLVLAGDAFNMRHPLTGGGMTVALHDAILLADLLHPHNLPSGLHDAPSVRNALDAFYWRRKNCSSIINVLAQALYTLFAAEDRQLRALQLGCFEYFRHGMTDGPCALLGGILHQPSVLAYHFFSVAFLAIWLNAFVVVGSGPLAFLRLPLVLIDAVLILARASQVFLPLIWREGFR